MPVIKVAPGSRAFEAVLGLYRRESSKLGFMPDGAFEDNAGEGTLLVAELDGNVAGYVMFRRTRQRHAAIVHLCVDDAFRGRGTARELFEAVKSRCGDCDEIRLRCRRDFPASNMWPKLGFVAVGDRPAKGKDKTLTVWRYELAPLPLFRDLEVNQAGAPRAVLDANVFLDLDETAEGREESEGLLADWLGEFVELGVTAELYNEINRRADGRDRERQRARARQFAQVARNVGVEETIFLTVREMLPPSSGPSGISDARQLAMTVAAGVTFFVTRDERLLNAADALDDRFGVEVLSPHELVRRFDELRNEDDYRPRPLFLGAGVTSAAARAEDLDGLADLMHVGQPSPEPRRRTLARLREMLAFPDRFQVKCIRKGDRLLTAYALDRQEAETLAVPFFAAEDSSLGRTAARHYAEAVIGIAANERRQLVQIQDAGRRVGDALADLGFSQEAGAWFKIALPVALPPDELAEHVERVGDRSPLIVDFAGRVAGELRAIARAPGLSRVRAATVERALWPAKITSTGLSCFIVPIQPRWAKDLFDRELAEGTLFGADPALALAAENVYYRAAQPAVITAPARVLWYVSDDRVYQGSMAVRACSHVNEMLIGPPKDLFRRFRRLGVYQWSDIFALAKGDVTHDVMAFRFSGTELLRRPIPWAAMQDVLKEHTGKTSQLQSPIAISEECFLSLYKRGMDADAA